MYAKIGDTSSRTGQVSQPEQWRFDWAQPYSRAQWPDLLPTTGGLTRLSPEQTAEILDGVGRAIDALGGRFTMPFTTLATTATRTAETGPPAGP